MTEATTTRKLTAILSADVKEYSRLMSQDERGTIRTLNAYKKAMSTLIEEYKGRVVDAPGDNLLAEFGSVVDAVNCAVEIQRELAERNEELTPARQMEFRIGINLGDVVEEDGRLYGDGVNIAARLESLAEGGGICISGKVHKEVKNRLGLEYEYLGEQTVKNIPEPVEVYRVLSFPGAAAHRVIKAKSLTERKWLKGAIAATSIIVVAVVIFAIWHLYFRPPPIEPASVEKMAYPLPDKPSIAVLPFTNMSGDPKQEYFSDGITEQIITCLSKVPNLLVIARNSTFMFKGKSVKVQKVAEEFGVRYVLEGSVQRSDKRIRITTQLVDAITGHHIWAEHYDRELKDIFAVQDEITMKIMSALQVNLTEGEQARLFAKGTNSLEAYIKSLQAAEHVSRRTKEDNVQAYRLAEEAIALDPNYAIPYRILAVANMADVWLKTSRDPKQSLATAITLSQKAIHLDDSLGRTHALLGWLYTMVRHHDKGIAECERAVSLDPNGATSHYFFGLALRYTGRHEESVRALEKAIRLNPLPPAPQLTALGWSYFFVGRYENAIEWCKKAVKQEPNDPTNHIALATAYIGAGREEEARAEAEEILRLDPNYSLQYYAKIIPYKITSDKERAVECLRKAGIPETPPLPLPDKPSIAVLPFTNMSEDPKEDYFSDGITEEIITGLSKVPRLFVIDRNSTFTYKGKPVKVQQVGRELGVKYVLEGSVRKAGDKVRITAQLVDAKTGNHLWAERYDRELKDIFAIQDEIMMKVIPSLQVTLTEGEQALIVAGGTDNFKAYTNFLQGLEYAKRFNKEGNLLARKVAQEAITLDKNYPRGYRLLATTYFVDVMLGISPSPKQSLAKAAELYQNVIAMDPSDAVAHGFLGYVYTMMRQHEKGIAEAEKAVTLNPNAADAQCFFGYILHFNGRHREAIEQITKAIRLNPYPPNWYFVQLGSAYCYAGKYEEAFAALKKALRISPNNLIAHTRLATTYSLSGHEQEARTEVAEILRINPKFSLARCAKTMPYKNTSDRDLFINALRKAGLK